jgi:hypothetical protein
VKVVVTPPNWEVTKERWESVSKVRRGSRWGLSSARTEKGAGRDEYSG